MMLKKTSELQGRFTLPGDKLGVIEEFLNGIGAYENDGIIRSSEAGIVGFDLKNRKIQISKNTRPLVIPKEDMDVVGEGGAVQRRTANIHIFFIDGKEISKPYSGVLHISSVGPEYAKNMGLAVRSGDIIKARIINTKNRLIQLSIEGPDYGVIYAFCSRCGTILEKQKTRLDCPVCGRKERRKIARTYGEEELV
jgi:exosome complex component CSL4